MIVIWSPNCLLVNRTMENITNRTLWSETGISQQQQQVGNCDDAGGYADGEVPLDAQSIALLAFGVPLGVSLAYAGPRRQPVTESAYL